MPARKSRPGTSSTKERAAAASGSGTAAASLWWLLPLLLVATLGAYYPALHGGVLWDDPAHLTRPELQSLSGLWRIWFDVGATQQYYPVSYGAFWLMHRLWGDDTLGYHLVNVALHASSAFLLALLLRRLKAPGAVFAALVFALHPVHVESVAWMTELKNTLSGALYLAAFWAYLDFDDTRRFWRYALAFLLFVLAVLSKTVAVTLPAAVLLVFWWRRGTLRWRDDVFPLAPFFIVGAGLGLFVAWVERSFAGAEGAEFQFTLVERCLIAGRAVWFYAGKLLWPADLIFIYPRWHVSQGVWWQYLFPVAALGAIAGLWLFRQRARGPLVAVLFFGGTLFPALGFFNVFAFQYSFVADHFQYLASISIIALASGLAATAVDRWRVPQTWTIVAAGVIASVLAGLTWRQSFQYSDLEVLYTTTLARNPECWMAHNNLGELAVRRSPDRINEAMEHFRQAIRLKPDYALAHDNLGVLCLRQGRTDEALEAFTKARQLAPRFFAPRLHLGNVLRDMKRPAEAVAAYEDALALRPEDLESRTNLAGVLLALNRPEEARTHLLRALEQDPSSSLIRSNLATAWTATGNALLKSGRAADSLAPYQEALRIAPDAVEAHNNIAVALLQLGRPEEAIPHLQAAVQLVPESAAMRANLDSVLATLRK